MTIYSQRDCRPAGEIGNRLGYTQKNRKGATAERKQRSTVWNSAAWHGVVRRRAVRHGANLFVIYAYLRAVDAWYSKWLGPTPGIY